MGAAEGKERRGKDGVPGYGWDPELSGLSRRKEWLGFVAGVGTVIAIGFLIAFLAFG